MSLIKIIKDPLDLDPLLPEKELPNYHARLPGNNDINEGEWVRVELVQEPERTFICKVLREKILTAAYVGARIWQDKSAPSKKPLNQATTSFKISPLFDKRPVIATKVYIRVEHLTPLYLDSPIPELSLHDEFFLGRHLLEHPVSVGFHYSLLVCLRRGGPGLASGEANFHAHLKVTQVMPDIAEDSLIITLSTQLHFKYECRLDLVDSWTRHKNPNLLGLNTSMEYWQDTEPFRLLDALFSRHNIKDSHDSPASLFRVVLVSGPKGIGKCTLIRCLAAGHGLFTNYISAGSLIHDTQMIMEQHVEGALKQGMSIKRPSLILLDLVDGLLDEQRGPRMTPFINRVISDEVMRRGHARQAPLLIVMTSVSPGSLDKSVNDYLLNSGHVRIEPPKSKQRLKLLKCLLWPKVQMPELEEIADKASGFLPVDLVSLVKLAQQTGQSLNKALGSISPSLKHDFRIATTPNVTWSQIAGIDTVRDKIRRIIETPLLKREQCKRLGIRPPKGILLHGPPGCSKTTIAKALANSGKFAFFSINGAQLYSAYVGESERIVRDTFAAARQASPSVIFVDELDVIIGKRDTGVGGGDIVQDRILATFLTEMDGADEKEAEFEVYDEELNNYVLVLGATNRKDAIDDAILRPGRFDHIIEIPLPDKEGRVAIFKLKLADKPFDVSNAALDYVAEQTDGCSGADIACIVNMAAMMAAREGKETLSVEHLNASWKQFKTSRVKTRQSLLS